MMPSLFASSQSPLVVNSFLETILMLPKNKIKAVGDCLYADGRVEVLVTI
jgi:hypothetical protein